MTRTTYTWDTAAVPTGEYFVYIEANDGTSALQGAYSVGTVMVDNRDAPSVPEIVDFALVQEEDMALIQWAPVDAPDIEGYRVYYGYASGDYEGFIDVGNSTSIEMLTLELERVFYVSVTAYDSSGNESSFGEELSGELGVYYVFLPLIM